MTILEDIECKCGGLIYRRGINIEDKPYYCVRCEKEFSLKEIDKMKFNTFDKKLKENDEIKRILKKGF